MVNQQTNFDFLIIGAGSAGCVLANRLSESGKHNVCVLEAGGSDARFWIQVPIGYGKTYYQKAVNWMFETVPQAGLNNKTSYWPRGKVLGGSSSINAMIYIRGNKKDYDDWAALGNSGWSYEDILPYFKKSETAQCGDAKYRGKSGPWYISDVSADMHPMTQTWIAAGQELGIEYNSDFNGKQQQGIGRYQQNTKNGIRMSAAKAYLHPVKMRKNLTVTCRAHVTRILFDGKKAIGVEYSKKGKLTKVFARKEIICSAGAVQSPQLLMLSGIGPKDHLQQHDIQLIHDHPHVGQHLQDHLGVDFLYKCNQPTLNDELHSSFGKFWAGLKYITMRKGPCRLSVNQGGGFIRSDDEKEQPDLQLYFSPVSYTKAPEKTRPLMNPDPFSAFLIGYSNCRVKSEGQITLASNDPFAAPVIDPNYLSHPDDISLMLKGSKLMRKLAQTKAFQTVITQEVRPGVDCQTDEQLIQDIKDYAWTVFHPSCTCRMGKDTTTSVVDARLAVHGIENLRVCDTSIMPFLVSGNTNAPTIMIAEKGADMILEDHRQG
jgi:choline dehydrogenase